MKVKKLLTALCICFANLLSGCKSDTTTIDNLVQSKESIDSTISTGHISSITSDKTDSILTYSKTNNVDIDLTTMGSTMVYSEVYNMTINPDEYTGKTIRASGPFTVFHDDNTGKDYFAVIITDATACCSQGIEFILAGEHSYPDDYPKVDTQITVTGKFNVYEEDGNKYCKLLDAELTINQWFRALNVEL